VDVLAEAVDGLATQPQPRVAEKNDWSDTHGPRVYRETAPRLSADSRGHDMATATRLMVRVPPAR
jgi:hypothetical protein